MPRTVVVPDGEAVRDTFGEAATVAPHALADGLEGPKAGGVDTDAFRLRWSTAANIASWPSPG